MEKKTFKIDWSELPDPSRQLPVGTNALSNSRFKSHSLPSLLTPSAVSQTSQKPRSLSTPAISCDESLAKTIVIQDQQHGKSITMHIYCNNDTIYGVKKFIESSWNISPERQQLTFNNRKLAHKDSLFESVFSYQEECHAILDLVELNDKVNITMPSGESFDIFFGFNDTVHDVKKNIEVLKGIPVHRQRLMCDGEILCDHQDAYDTCISLLDDIYECDLVILEKAVILKTCESTTPFEIHEGDTVRDVKERISRNRKLGLPLGLFYNGTELAEGTTLAEFEDCTLDLFLFATVKLPSNELITLCVNENDTVGYVKSLIEVKTGIPIQQQRLIYFMFRPIKLKDNSTIEQYQEEFTLMVRDVSISVTLPNNQITKLFVHKDDTVDDIKDLIHSQHNILSSQQRLMCNNEILGNLELAVEYKNSTLSLVLANKMISIKLPSGDVLRHSVNPDDTIGYIKSSICIDIPLQEKCLRFNGRTLKDKLTLSQLSAESKEPIIFDDESIGLGHMSLHSKYSDDEDDIFCHSDDEDDISTPSPSPPPFELLLAVSSVSVNLPDGEKMTVNLYKNDTIGHIKASIHEAQGIPVHHQSLWFDNKEIKNDKLVLGNEFYGSTFDMIYWDKIILINVVESRVVIPFKIFQDDTVLNIKRRIADIDELSIPPDEQRLSFNGKILEDETKLINYEESTLDFANIRHTIEINLHNDDVLTVPVGERDTVSFIKSIIFAKQNIPVDRQCLLYGDEEMKDDDLIWHHSPISLVKMVHVNTPAGDVVKVPVRQNDTVHTIKEFFYNGHRQRLMLNGEILDNDASLSNYEDATLDLVYTDDVIEIYTLDDDNSYIHSDKYTFNLELNLNNDTIRIVKMLIEKERNIPFNEQHLIFDGKELEDNSTIPEVNKDEFSVLFLVYRKKILFVKVHVFGKSLPFCINDGDTIGTVNKAFKNVFDSQYLQQHLLLNGKELDDDSPLSEYENLVLDLKNHFTLIFVRDAHGDVIPIAVTDNDTLRDIKHTIEIKKEIPYEEQRIHYSGKELDDDDMAISTYKIMFTLEVIGQTFFEKLPQYDYGYQKLDLYHLDIKVLVNMKESGAVREVMVHCDDTIHYIKTLVEKRDGIPVEKQRFLFNGKELEDKFALSHYGKKVTFDLVLLEKAINAKFENGKILTVYFHPDDTIYNIKRSINIKKNIPINAQCLKFDGQELGNELSASEYTDSTLDLVCFNKVVFVKLPDGNMEPVCVCPSYTIGDIKKELNLNIPLNQQRLLINNEKQDDNVKLAQLSDYESVLHKIDDDNAYDLSNSSCCELILLEKVINVKISEDRVISVYVHHQTDTLDDLKASIETQEGIPIVKQRLIFNGLVLDDDHVLLDYDDNSTLELVLLSNIIFVKLPSGEVETFNVHQDDTIYQIKQCIQSRLKIQLNQQCLLMNSQELSNESVLQYNNSTLELTIRDIFIKVKLHNGKAIELYVNQNDDVSYIKESICNLEAIELDKQRLLCNGKEVKNEKIVSLCTKVTKPIFFDLVCLDKVIFVRAPDSEVMTFHVHSRDLLYHIKVKINKIKDMAVDKQHITFNGKELEDTSVLSEYDKQTLDVICLDMKLSIRMWNNEVMSIFLHKDDTTSALKARIKEKICIPVDQQRIFFDNKLLEDGKLSTWHIDDQSVLVLQRVVEITVKVFSKILFPLEVSLSDEVISVKNQISKNKDVKKLNISVQELDIIFRNESLEDHSSLSDCKVKNYSVLDVAKKWSCYYCEFSNSSIFPSCKECDKPPYNIDDNYIFYDPLNDVKSLLENVETEKVDTEAEFATWSVENFEEEQVFEKPDYGVKVVVPSSSVQEGESIQTSLRVVEPDIKLPDGFVPVSCFFEIGTSGSYFNPVDLHMEHSVQVNDASMTENLRFLTLKDSEFVSCDENEQSFDPNESSGMVRVSHFSKHIYVIVFICKNIGSIIQPPLKSYSITPFYKRTSENCWQIKIVFIPDLKPYYEQMKHLYEKGWIKRDSAVFSFKNSDEAIRVDEHNDFFEIKNVGMLEEIYQTKIDECKVDSDAFPLLHFEVNLKSFSSADLKLVIEGMTDNIIVKIPESELSICNNNTDVVAQPPKKIVIEDNLLKIFKEAPKPKHLTNQLNPVKSQWWEIGEQLDVEYTHLESIKRDPTCNNTRRLSEVCHKWIISDNDVTWRRIWTVVERSPISNQKLCREIKEFLEQPEMISEYLHNSKHPSVGLETVMPNLVNVKQLQDEMQPPLVISEYSQIQQLLSMLPNVDKSQSDVSIFVIQQTIQDDPAINNALLSVKKGDELIKVKEANKFNDEDIHKLCTWMDNKIAEIGRMDLPSDEIDSLKLQMEEHEKLEQEVLSWHSSFYDEVIKREKKSNSQVAEIQQLERKWKDIKTKLNSHSEALALHMLKQLSAWVEQRENALGIGDNLESIKQQLADNKAFKENMATIQPNIDALKKAATHHKSLTNVELSIKIGKLEKRFQKLLQQSLERHKQLLDAKRHLKDTSSAIKEDYRSFNFDVWRQKFIIGFTDQKKREVSNFFRRCDVNRDGILTRKEFTKGLKELDLATDEFEIKKVVDTFDKNKNGLIDLSEIIAVLKCEKQTPGRSTKALSDAEKIDMEIQEHVSKCCCAQKFLVMKVAKERYKFGTSSDIHLVRLPRKNVVVKVGGGWESLHEFITKNDPCRVPGFVAARRGTLPAHNKVSKDIGRTQSVASSILTTSEEVETATDKQSHDKITPRKIPLTHSKIITASNGKPPPADRGHTPMRRHDETSASKLPVPRSKVTMSSQGKPPKK